MIKDAQFDQDQGVITLKDYPFPVTKTRTINQKDIIAFVDWFPPAIITKQEEILFIPRTQIELLVEFTDQHKIHKDDTIDVWSLILDPFLDTEFSAESTENTIRLIESLGIVRKETLAFRKQLEKPMLLHTMLTWEWQHYGFYDLLTVMKKHYQIKMMFNRQKKWLAFYQHAITVALTPIYKDKHI